MGGKAIVPSGQTEGCNCITSRCLCVNFNVIGNPRLSKCNIELSMGKERLIEVNSNMIESFPLRFVDSHRVRDSSPGPGARCPVIKKKKSSCKMELTGTGGG
ncbi:hypothetical protein AVEN_180813-1 [Araneus ventricosus]|uniref:Uncharacterized protein n=1 Tax=Araneus ventricosus TaxID=182803 RepID=A0A4Y2P894_ARAVE|nr:hypothetical protein AVEN_180813-1 [Araneus ventricosus]